MAHNRWAASRRQHGLFVFLGLQTILSCPLPAAVPASAFLQNNCVACHGPKTRSGGLDLTALGFDLKNPKVFAEWVKIHDRVRDGEMPPKGIPRPGAAASDAFLRSVAAPMVAADRA